ncbi:hypothetical protein O6H91_15G018000 [Diphasiastrum complanatum]|nr:hypothetical protein O6H91_15G018000 [Diphasiastrum complanatum]
MEVMHRFRPKFMNTILASPSYYRSAVSHQCNSSASYKDGSHANDFSQDHSECEDFCVATPYVLSGTYHTQDDEYNLSRILLEVRAKHLKSCSSEVEEDAFDAAYNTVPLCSFFQMGSCNRGNSCSFAHSLSAKPATCKFFMSASGCRYGEGCRFWHDYQIVLSSEEELTAELEEAISSGMLEYLTVNKYVLLIGDSDFSFAKYLASIYEPTSILATMVKTKAEVLEASNVCEEFEQIVQSGIQVLWGIDPTVFVPRSCIKNIREDEKLWAEVGCIVWNFPFLGSDEDTNTKRNSIARFFASISLVLMMLHNTQVSVLLTKSNSQYAQLQVERVARESFFFLRRSFPPHDIILTCYNCRRKPMQGSFFKKKFITYAFELEFPFSST